MPRVVTALAVLTMLLVALPAAAQTGVRSDYIPVDEGDIGVLPDQGERGDEVVVGGDAGREAGDRAPRGAERAVTPRAQRAAAPQVVPAAEGALAQTGFHVTVGMLAAVALVLLGGVFVLASRRVRARPRA